MIVNSTRFNLCCLCNRKAVSCNSKIKKVVYDHKILSIRISKTYTKNRETKFYKIYLILYCSLFRISQNIEFFEVLEERAVAMKQVTDDSEEFSDLMEMLLIAQLSDLEKV